MWLWRLKSACFWLNLFRRSVVSFPPPPYLQIIELSFSTPPPQRRWEHVRGKRDTFSGLYNDIIWFTFVWQKIWIRLLGNFFWPTSGKKRRDFGWTYKVLQKAQKSFAYWSYFDTDWTGPALKWVGILPLNECDKWYTIIGIGKWVRRLSFARNHLAN